jgi:hypothetical protein
MIQSIFQIPIVPGLTGADLVAAEAIAESVAEAASAPKDQKDYLAIPIEWAIDGVSAPDATAVLSATNSVMIRKFRGDVGNQDVFIPVLLPPDKKPASAAIKYRVHFFLTEAVQPNNEGVVFAVKSNALATPDLLSAALGTAYTCEITMLNSVATAWAAATPKAVGDNVIPLASPNGFWYQASAHLGDFNTGAQEPAWPPTPGQTVVDNHVTWRCMGTNCAQNSLVTTGWSTPFTVPGLSAGKLFLMLNFARTQDAADDTYAQKVGVAFIELAFDQEPAP